MVLRQFDGVVSRCKTNIPQPPGVSILLKLDQHGVQHMGQTIFCSLGWPMIGDHTGELVPSWLASADS